MWKNTAHSYGTVSIFLHWGVALLVIGMLAAGFYMEGLPAGLLKLKIYNTHKSVGILVLALTVLRWLWHLYAKRPRWVATLTTWEKRAAKTVHYALYALLVVMPLSGWLMSSAAGRPVRVFKVIPLPDIIAPNPVWADIWRNVHGISGWILAGLIVLHFAAALKHHIMDKDDTLRRMLPRRHPVSGKGG